MVPPLLFLLLSISLVIVNGDRRTRLLLPVRSTTMSRTAEGDAGALPPPSPAGLCLKVGEYEYPCQEYKVTTEDGYILSLNRIPTGGQPVLLQHGVLVDGMTWLLNGMNQSLALVLADRGYDVWIANTRGTQWSRRHISLDPAQRDRFVINITSELWKIGGDIFLNIKWQLFVYVRLKTVNVLCFR